MSKKILLVDDDPDSIVLIEKILTREGFEVIKASSGTQALEVCQTNKPDLILLDLILPDKPGLELFAEIRKIDALKQTPILAFTANALKEVEEKARQAGFADFLQKPILPQDLIQKIKMHLPN